MRAPREPQRGPSGSGRYRIATLAILVVLLPLLAAAGTAAGQLGVVTAVPGTSPPGGPEVHVLGPQDPVPGASQRAVLFIVSNDGPGEIRDVTAAFRTSTFSTVTGLPTAGGGAPGGLALVGIDGERALGTIGENDSEGVVLVLQTPQLEGTAPLTVALSYVDASGVPRVAIKEIGVPIGPPEPGILRVDYEGSALRAGEVSPVRFRLHNPTEHEIRDLTVEFAMTPTTQLAASAAEAASLIGGGALGASTAAAPAGETRLLRAVDLPPDTTIAVEGEVITSRNAPDLVPLTLTASYVSEDVGRTERFDFGAPIQGSVKLRLLDLREEPRGEEEMVLSGVIVNTGSGTAWNTRVRVPEGGGYAETGPALIEDLEPNEPVAFRIATTRRADAEEPRALMEVEWNDDRGTLYRETVKETATPLPPREGFSPGDVVTEPWFLLAAGSAVALGLLAAKKRGLLNFPHRPG